MAQIDGFGGKRFVDACYDNGKCCVSLIVKGCF